MIKYRSKKTLVNKLNIIIFKEKLVELSTLPLIISLSFYVVLLDVVLLLDSYLYTNNFFLVDFFVFLFTVILYFNNNIIETNFEGISLVNNDNKYVGYLYFLLSELILFISLFIVLIYLKYASLYLYNNILYDFNTTMYTRIGLTLFNLILLFLTGITVTITQLCSYNSSTYNPKMWYLLMIFNI